MLKTSRKASFNQVSPAIPGKSAPSSLISTPPAVTVQQGEESVLQVFKNEIYVRDLEHVRNRYALRLQKGIAEKLLKHKHARELCLYLELKPLFQSSVIFAHEGKLPYKKVAEFLGEGISTVRKKIAVLKRLRLVKFDYYKNMHLARYDRLREILKHEGKRKYKLLNNGTTEFTVKQIAIYENLNRQHYQVRKKILERELTELYYERKMLDPLKSSVQHPIDIKKGCEQYFSKSFIRKYTRQISKYLPHYVRKYQNVYNVQVQQLAIRYPQLNADITLSLQGIARLLNRKSASCAYYQVQWLKSLGYVTSEPRHYRLQENSPAIYEAMTGLRRDVFAYDYPTRKTRSGRIRRHFRKGVNLVETRVNATFY